MDSIIMTERVIIPRRAQKILKGTIQIEPTCSQRLHLKVHLYLVFETEKKRGRGGVMHRSHTYTENICRTKNARKDQIPG